MKLWLISQEENDGYDTYDSAVVAAETVAEARRISPDGSKVWNVDGTRMIYPDTGKPAFSNTWAFSLDKVVVQYLGIAAPGTEAGLILASFNAG